MKKKSKNVRVILTILIISLFCSICIFSGCKKYKDGPLISFRSKTERIANTWKFQKYIVNGIDSTAQKAAVTLQLTKDNKATLTTNNAAGDIYGGTWRFGQTTDINAKPITFKSNKDNLEIFVYSGFDDISGMPSYLAYSYYCNILELKQNNMHLQGTYSYTYSGAVLTKDNTYNNDTTIVGTFDWTLAKK